MALSTKATQTDLDNLETLVDTKANVGDSYLKTETYSNIEVDDKISLSWLELRLNGDKSGTSLPPAPEHIITWDTIENNIGGLFSVSTDLTTITILKDCYINLMFIFGVTCSLETHVRMEVKINGLTLANHFRYYLYKTNEYDYRDVTIPNIKLNQDDEVSLKFYGGGDTVFWNNYPTNFPASLVLTEVKLKDL